MKPSEDGSGDTILRLYESKKAADTAEIRFEREAGLYPEKAYVCDMLENVTEEVPVKEGRITLSFRAFEVKTIRIR